MKSLTFSLNKLNSLRAHRVKSRKGFSIVEVAIAMGVVTLLLTTFLGVFGPAQKNIQRALSTKDASRMKDTLSNEMSILRPTEVTPSGPYSTSFEKAFRMIKESHDEAKAVLMYQYRADALADPTDGILPPYAGSDGIQGRDYIIQTAVRTLDVDAVKIKDELKVVDGPVFVVRMTQLVDNDATDGQLILTAWTEAGVTNPDLPSAQLTAATYPKAVIAFRAEFFKLSANKEGFIYGGKWTFESDTVPAGKVSVGNALTEVNMAIRR
ncbi:MAG: hypothetical protein ACI9E1_001671 [Cryomorphaceae bacterium]|jgi:hypothetical protein